MIHTCTDVVTVGAECFSVANSVEARFHFVPHGLSSRECFFRSEGVSCSARDASARHSAKIPIPGGLLRACPDFGPQVTYRR